MDWDKGVCFVATDSVGDFNGVILFGLVIGIPHKQPPE